MSNSKVVKFMLIALVSMQASPIFATSINYALNGTATASSSWNEHVPENVIDGDNTTYWNSGRFPSAWVEIDLGASKDIAEIKASVAQLPEGSTVHNIYLDNVLSHTWSQFTDVGDLLTWVLPTNTDAQLIKIETISSPSWVAWGDISVLNEVSQVPVPATIWMFGTSLIGLIGVKKKRLKSSISPA